MFNEFTTQKKAEVAVQQSDNQPVVETSVTEPITQKETPVAEPLTTRDRIFGLVRGALATGSKSLQEVIHTLRDKGFINAERQGRARNRVDDLNRRLNDIGREINRLTQDQKNDYSKAQAVEVYQDAMNHGITLNIDAPDFDEQLSKYLNKKYKDHEIIDDDMKMFRRHTKQLLQKYSIEALVKNNEKADSLQRERQSLVNNEASRAFSVIEAVNGEIPPDKRFDSKRDQLDDEIAYVNRFLKQMSVRKYGSLIEADSFKDRIIMVKADGTRLLVHAVADQNMQNLINAFIMMEKRVDFRVGSSTSLDNTNIKLMLVNKIKSRMKNLSGADSDIRDYLQKAVDGVENTLELRPAQENRTVKF